MYSFCSVMLSLGTNECSGIASGVVVLYNLAGCARNLENQVSGKPWYKSIPNLQCCDYTCCIYCMVKLSLKEAKHWIFQFGSPSPNYHVRVQGKGATAVGW